MVTNLSTRYLAAFYIVAPTIIDRMQRRHFIFLSGRSLLGLLAARLPLRLGRRRFAFNRPVGGASEILYNGIVPPSPFPPVLDQPWSTNELPYYITSPPEVIRIDTGRQLFVDDFLIESMVRLWRTYHEPEPHEGNPLIAPTDEFVQERTDNQGLVIKTQLACPFSDGVWWDVQARKFRAWYLGGPNSLRLAESGDGFEWTRVGSDGIVMGIPPQRDSGMVWIDGDETDPALRYKMSFYSFVDLRNWVFGSADGVNWPPYYEPLAKSSYYSSDPNAPTGDRTTFFYNPFRKKWVWSLRDLLDRRAYGGSEYHRMRRYMEGDDLFDAAMTLDESGFWIEADTQDLEEAGPPGRPQLEIPQVYNVDGFPYESIMIFGLTILSSNAWQDASTGEAFPKRNEVYLGFSRDGFYMTRPSGNDRRPFVAIGLPDSWNEGNVQTVGGGCIVVGEPEAEMLRFYHSGRSNEFLEDGSLFRRAYLGCATLRRDGFASIDGTIHEGVLTTSLLRFDHPNGFLFVNVDTSNRGELRAELVDEDGVVVPGFERDRCVPIQADSTRRPVAWDDHQSLAAFSGKPFRFRFYLRSGFLYSFWVAPTSYGASEGYLGAGGPAYEGYRDVSPPDTTPTDGDERTRTLSITVTPNPIFQSAEVTYDLPAGGFVTIRLYDTSGRVVRSLLDRFQSSGRHNVPFDRYGLADGVYFCRVQTARYSDAVKVVIVGGG